MNRTPSTLAGILAALFVASCGGTDQAPGDASAADAEQPVAVLKPDEKYNVTAKPSGPVKIDYRIIGTPVVGQPVTIDLLVHSNVDDMPVKLEYLSNDSTAMEFPETQSKSVSVAFLNEERSVSRQVTVVPSREGRLFLNVTASLPTDTGSLQTVKAIPIQVGAAPRDLTPSVPTTTDEEGNELREMPAD